MKFKDNTLLWFYLDCIVYEKNGVFIITAKQSENVMLSPDIIDWIGKHKYKNLRELLEAEVWNNWEDHSPFILKSFYEQAICLTETDYKTSYYVSE